MRNLVFIIALIFGFNVYAQEEFKRPKTFVRVYNLYGNMINKGKVLKVTDTTLILKKNTMSVVIPVSNIGLIKTKRSSKHNLLIGAAVGSIFGAISIEDSTELEEFRGPYALLGGITGGAIGAAVGGITILFKNSKLYVINGDVLKWQVFEEAINAHKQ